MNSTTNGMATPETPKTPKTPTTPVTKTDPTVRLLFAAAPACFLAGWLLMRPIDGQAEPGGWWTAAHAVWLAGFLMFAAMSLRFGRLITTGDAGPAAGLTAGRRAALGVSVVTVLLSSLVNVVQLVLDLVGGFRAADRAELQDMFAGVKDIPGAEQLIYGVGAQLVFVGLVVFAVLAAVARRAGAWAAGLVTGGTVVLAVAMGFGRNHWLVPVGMTVLLAGLVVLGEQLAGRPGGPGDSRRAPAAWLSRTPAG
ncbi:hypothetical protein [Streptomyces sp. NPDC058371]|uniref:hypothetical protein n=1 Tax=Streptomyces sp. NPDC058371 TaxID=3346463 RepID=UPI00365F56A1